MAFFKANTHNYRAQGLVLADILRDEIIGSHNPDNRILQELHDFVTKEWITKSQVSDLQNYIVLLNNIERLADSLKTFVATYPASKGLKNLASRLVRNSLHFIYLNLSTTNDYRSAMPGDMHGIKYLFKTLQTTQRLLAKPNTRNLNATIESIHQLEKFKDNRHGPFSTLLNAIYKASLSIVASVMQVLPGMNSTAQRIRNSSYNTSYHFHKKNLLNFDVTYFKKIASSKKKLKKLTQELQPLLPKPKPKNAVEGDEMPSAPKRRKTK